MEPTQSSSSRMAAACAFSLVLILPTFCSAAEPAAAPAARATVRHPNLLLNRDEIDEVKRKIATQPWAAALLEKLKHEAEGRGGSSDGVRNSALLYALTGEKRYADYARGRLLEDARNILPQYEKIDIK